MHTTSNKYKHSLNSYKEKNYYVGKLDVKQGVKLLMITPIHPDNGNKGPCPLTPREYLLNQTHVDEIYIAGAPLHIQDTEDSLKVAPLVVEKSKWAESRGYDAVVINCMLDAGAREAQRAVKIPVIGLRDANMALASWIGEKPALIYPRTLPISKLPEDEDKTLDKLLEEGRASIEDQHADVLIPNCGYLGGLAQRMQENLAVPVLANFDIALKLAEFFVIFNITPRHAWGMGMSSSPLQQFLSPVGTYIRHWTTKQKLTTCLSYFGAWIKTGKRIPYFLNSAVNICISMFRKVSPSAQNY